MSWDRRPDDLQRLEDSPRPASDILVYRSDREKTSLWRQGVVDEASEPTSIEPTPIETKKPASKRFEWLAERALGLMIAALFFWQYVRTLAPSLVPDDPSEFQVLVARLGLPHGTSYPLYVWLGHIFTRLPITDDVAYRLNLFSAVLGAGTIYLIYLLVLEVGRTLLGSTRHVSAGIAAALVGYSHTFWSVSLVSAEYTLHTFLGSLALLLLLRWERFESRKWLIGSFAVLGAMFGNHSLTFALIPATAVYVLIRVKPSREKYKDLGLAVAAGTITLLFSNVFLFYLLWRRQVPYDHWQWILMCPKFFEIPENVRDNFWYAWWYEMTCRQFRFELQTASMAHRIQEFILVPHRFAAELFPFAALTSIVGWMVLWTRRHLNILFTGIIVTHAYLISGLTVTIKNHIYFLIAVILAAIYTGIAVGFFVERSIERAIPQAWKRHTTQLTLVYTLMAAFFLQFINERSRQGYFTWSRKQRGTLLAMTVMPRIGARPNLGSSTQTLSVARKIVDELPPDAIVFANWGIHYGIEYVARIERGIEGITVLEAYPYGIGRREFVFDYLDLINDPKRERRLFIAEPLDLPFIEGLVEERKTLYVTELVRRH